MSRIGSILSGVERRLLKQLTAVNAAAAIATYRTSTERRVNFPSDDPSAFLAISQYQSQLKAITAARSNVTAAHSFITDLKETVGQVRDQIEAIQTELGKATPSQETIDEAIGQINALATTKINGRRVLDGSADYQVSGRDATQVRQLRVYATPGHDAATVRPTVAGQVVESAEQARLVYRGASGQITSDATFTLMGRQGNASIEVNGLESLGDAAQRVNDASDQTGIVATVSGDQLTLTSVDYGTQAKVAVAVTSGDFDVAGGDNQGQDFGKNVVAEINGQTYEGDTVARTAVLRHQETGQSIQNDATFRLTGALGHADFTIDRGSGLNDTLVELSEAINAESSNTGVTSYVDGTELVLQSQGTGSDEEISIAVASGTFSTTTGEATALGSDASKGSAAVRGNRVYVSQNDFRFEAEFAGGFSGSFDTMTVVAEPLVFALSPDVSRSYRLALPSLFASQLGGLSGTLDQIATGGTHEATSNRAQAARIVGEALNVLGGVEGTVAGFAQAAVAGSASLLDAFKTDLEDAIEKTDGYDEDEEKEKLSLYQALASNAVSGLAILSQQRSAIVAMLRDFAGLD
jgi:hypothetical protein